MHLTLQSTAERKSMSMQMISDEMHSDTIAIRQKKKEKKKGKWEVITFITCTFVRQENTHLNDSVEIWGI